MGDAVTARRQRWRIVRVAPFEQCAVVTLCGMGSDNAGHERQVIAPFERLEPIQRRPRLRRVGPARWRRSCRAILAGAGSADALHTAMSASIDLLPYQLSPAIAIVRGLASRILIADDVGLGKTIEAALIVGELLARQAAPRVLIVTPAGLRDQWVDELSSRFGLSAVIVDMQTLRRRRLHGGVSTNPWSALPIAITSLDYVKRPEILAAALHARWDLVIVDEAHHVQTGTDRHDAMSALCAQAAYVVLLSATPHNGDNAAFSALCALGGHGDELLVFRRTRADVGLARPRRIHQLRVRATPESRLMHRRLERFATAALRDHAGPEAALAVTLLRKRAASSPYALEQTVRRRLADLEPTGAGSPQLPLPFDDPTGELDASDAAPAWTVPALHDPDHERHLLSELAEAARRASNNDAKLAAAARLLRRLREPVIIFTEYRDTLMHLRDRIAPDAAVVHGGLSWRERQAALARFAGGSVLLTTDAAGEGLNLQHTSRVVINFELPWNPVRLEQRIGRVDRIGQTRTVHAFHIIAADAAEQGVLERLSARSSQAHHAIGAADPLSCQRSDGALWNGQREPLLDPCGAAAAAEHARVALSRRLAAGLSSRPLTDHVLPEDVLATRTRRSPTRARLRGWTLVVLRSTLSDETGRIVALGLTSTFTRGRGGLRSLDKLRAIADGARDPALDSWLETARTTHRAFWTRRIEREEAIAAYLAGRDRSRQVGLFDRRALQALESERRTQQGTRDECRRRIAAARRASHCAADRCIPSLVLHP